VEAERTPFELRVGARSFDFPAARRACFFAGTFRFLLGIPIDPSRFYEIGKRI
jgi:hypothetical protein